MAESFIYSIQGSDTALGIASPLTMLAAVFALIAVAAVVVIYRWQVDAKRH